MRYLLDTNIFIAALKAVPAARRRLETLPASAILLSPVVLGELETGVEKSAQVERNRARLAAIVASLEVPPLDASVSAAYAQLRSRLGKQGTPIGANDLWIAAHALVLGATLVTDNVREFSRVDGLTVENWLADDLDDR